MIHSEFQGRRGSQLPLNLFLCFGSYVAHTNKETVSRSEAVACNQPTSRTVSQSVSKPLNVGRVAICILCVASRHAGLADTRFFAFVVREQLGHAKSLRLVKLPPKKQASESVRSIGLTRILQTSAVSQNQPEPSDRAIERSSDRASERPASFVPFIQ